MPHSVRPHRGVGDLLGLRSRNHFKREIGARYTRKVIKTLDEERILQTLNTYMLCCGGVVRRRAAPLYHSRAGFKP